MTPGLTLKPQMQPDSLPKCFRSGFMLWIYMWKMTEISRTWMHDCSDPSSKKRLLHFDPIYSVFVLHDCEVSDATEDKISVFWAETGQNQTDGEMDRLSWPSVTADTSDSRGEEARVDLLWNLRNWEFPHSPFIRESLILIMDPWVLGKSVILGICHLPNRSQKSPFICQKQVEGLTHAWCHIFW